MGNSVKKIAVLTGGGDCPGLNAVIRALTKTAIRKYGWEVIGLINGFAGMINLDYKLLDEAATSGILHRGGTILGTTNRDNPFRYAIGEQDGEIIFEDVSDRAIKNMLDIGVDALVVIGGDGSLSIAKELNNKGFPVVGIPKTIDNDLCATDVTFGFDTALTTATEAIDKLHTTAESHHRVMILEVMGRYAGWIALHAGIAGGADVILIPEIPFTIAGACKKIKERADSGKKFSIVVVAEGAKLEDGQMVVQRTVKESHDPIRLGGIGNHIGQAIEDCTGMETRVTILGHLQRGGSPTAYDRILSTRYGVGGVELVAQAKFGQMAALNGTKIIGVPLQAAVNQLKTVAADGELVLAAEAVGISFGR